MTHIVRAMNRPSDLSVQAVCMNNLAVIRKGDKVNSYNKLKQVSSNPSVIEKLSTKQRKSIGFNRSILLILLGKVRVIFSLHCIVHNN